MQSHPLKNWLIFMGLLAAAVGCATTPPAKEMTPSVATAPARPGNKTLKVLPLQEGENYRNNLAKWNIKADSFQEALVGTLKQTGRFQGVFTSQEGDYLLRPTLISMDVNFGIPTSIHLLINYRLVDVSSGKEFWQGNLYSQGTSQWGRGRISGAYETAVKNNLSQLAQKLAGLEL